MVKFKAVVWWFCCIKKTDPKENWLFNLTNCLLIKAILKQKSPIKIQSFHRGADLERTQYLEPEAHDTKELQFKADLTGFNYSHVMLFDCLSPVWQMQSLIDAAPTYILHRGQIYFACKHETLGDTFCSSYLFSLSLSPSLSRILLQIDNIPTLIIVCTYVKSAFTFRTILYVFHNTQNDTYSVSLCLLLYVKSTFTFRYLSLVCLS